MKTTHMAKLALLVLTAVTLAGCLLIPIDDGYDNRNSHDNGRHRGENHEGRR